MTPVRLEFSTRALEISQRIRATPLLDFDTVLAREIEAGNDPAIISTALAVAFAEAAARALRRFPQETRLVAQELFLRHTGVILAKRLDDEPEEPRHVAH